MGNSKEILAGLLLLFVFVNSHLLNSQVVTQDYLSRIDSLNEIIDGSNKNDSLSLTTHMELHKILCWINPDTTEFLIKRTIGLIEEMLIKNHKPSFKTWLLNKKASMLYSLGWEYGNQGDIKRALLFHLKSLKIKLGLNNVKLIIEQISHISTTYVKIGNLTRALDWSDKNLNLCIKTNERKYLIGTYVNIGTIYSDLGHSNIAILYHLKALKFLNKLEEKEWTHHILNNLGTYFHSNGALWLAQRCHQKSLRIRKVLGNENYVAQSLNNIGEVALKLGNPDEALDYINASLKLFESNNRMDGICLTKSNLGAIYLRKSDLVKAHKLTTEAYTLAIGMGRVDYIGNTAELLSKILDKQGKSLASLKMHKLHAEMKDSINNGMTQKNIFRLSNRYSLFVKNERIRSLGNLGKLTNTRFKLWIWGSIFTITLAMITFMVMFQLKRKKMEVELNVLRSNNHVEKVEKQRREANAIPVFFRRKIKLIEFKEIVSFGTQKKYVLSYCKEGKSYVVDYTMSQLEKILPDNFVRVHRSFILNTNEIMEITKTGYKGKVVFIMKDKRKIPSSLGYSNVIRELMEGLRVTNP